MPRASTSTTQLILAALALSPVALASYQVYARVRSLTEESPDREAYTVQTIHNSILRLKEKDFVEQLIARNEETDHLETLYAITDTGTLRLREEWQALIILYDTVQQAIQKLERTTNNVQQGHHSQQD